MLSDLFVGRTEEELTHENVPFEAGISRYRELARGQIIGDSYGVLKLLVCLEDHRLLGVHVFGTGATELIHIGQAVMGCGGTVDYLVDAVFNYPTLCRMKFLGLPPPRMSTADFPPACLAA